jgi:hypothetical protein
VSKIVSRRVLLSVVLVALVAGAVLGLTVTNGRSARNTTARTLSGASHATETRSPNSLTKIEPCINCAAVPGQTHYYAEGVTLSHAPAGYRPSVSRSEVLALLQQSDFAAGSSRKPSVRVWSARGGHHPGGRSYPAWVITYSHTAPTSFGPAPVSQKPDCAFVSIYDLRDRVWTTHFQDCPDNAVRSSRTHGPVGGSSSCDYACTPPNQDALDADASDAQRIAGRSYYTGAIVHADTNTVDLYLTAAPESVVDQLDAEHPGIYVIHNDAPNTSATLLKLEAGFDDAALRAQGIDVTEWGPTADGYLQVGVTSDVATAQATLNQIYGPNVVHVFRSEPFIFDSRTATPTPVGFLVGAIRTVGGPAGEWRRKGGGLATVFNSRGRAVAARRIRPGRDFTFRLAPGRYWLGFGRNGRQDRAGCPRRLVAIHAGKTTHSDLSIGCDWP